MNTQTDTPTPPNSALMGDIPTQTPDKSRRVDVPTVEDDNDENEPNYDGSEAMQNMWQRNSY
jgi:hypothetical protein